MSSLLAKASTAIHRTKQAALVKIGKADATVDIEFNQEREKLLAHFKACKEFKKSTKKLMKAMENLSKAQITLAQDLTGVYDTAGDLYSAVTKNQDTANQLNESYAAFNSTFTADILDPARKYLQQFKEVEKRIATRSTRKADMDRYRHELLAFQEKAKDKRIAVAEEKYETAKTKYDAINDELTHDMPVLLNDRVTFFEPVFATYLYALNEYYVSGDAITGQNIHMVQHIDRASAHTHAKVITPKETSAAFQQFTPVHSSVSSPTSTHGDYAQPTSAVPPAMQGGSPNSGYGAPAQGYGAAAPAPAPRGAPGRIQARALYDFPGGDADELPFRVGDVLTVHNQNGEWWEGEINGRRGLLPSNYVQLLNMSTVDKRIILLTGAGRGLGLAVTKLLLQEEKNIHLLAACRSVDAGEKSIRTLLEGIDIQSNGNTLQIIPIDLSSPDTIRDAAKSIEHEHGRLDVLINNAAIADRDSAKKTFDINFYGTKLMDDAFIPLLSKSKDARLVEVSSGLGAIAHAQLSTELKQKFDAEDLTFTDLNSLAQKYVGGDIEEFGDPSKGMGSYGQSKQFLNAYGRMLSRQLKPQGVTVSLVCPGFCNTALNGFRGTRSTEEGAKSIIEATRVGIDQTGLIWRDDQEIDPALKKYKCCQSRGLGPL
ncbi:SH3 domain-containing protein [Planoprotostelium fungivorum]|uniref:SH3 domain-containing protein n=1 Tax=Planoprotostelium fungivorum TaxID=1890364 RepID=A0A2P6NTS4_9EUKA|nr:SH3 domain-containing protein [Planoprotostelium fungivorum]